MQTEAVREHDGKVSRPSETPVTNLEECTVESLGEEKLTPKSQQKTDAPDVTAAAVDAATSSTQILKDSIESMPALDAVARQGGSGHSQETTPPAMEEGGGEEGVKDDYEAEDDEEGESAEEEVEEEGGGARMHAELGGGVHLEDMSEEEIQHLTREECRKYLKLNGKFVHVTHLHPLYFRVKSASQTRIVMRRF